LFGKKIKEMSSWVIAMPASFLTGVLISTWINYIASYLFHYIVKVPLIYGNIITFLYLILLSLYFVFSKSNDVKGIKVFESLNKRGIGNFIKSHKFEIIIVLLLTIFYGFFFGAYMSISKGNIILGEAQCKDLELHVALARSFSSGSNFPTEYPYFPNGKMNYHFLFQFLVGNLEFLGMRLDVAFNFMSTITMVAFLVLLYALTILITGRRWAGVLTVTFFIFRSSLAIFTFSTQFKSFGSLIKGILKNEKYIGDTSCESWGLWTQNVYVGQRHFAFSLAIMVFVLILVFPMFRKMNIALLKASKAQPEETNWYWVLKFRLRVCFREIFLKKDSWLPRNLKNSIAIGIILGLMGFWNGAVFISTIAMLFIIAIVSKHKLEYLNIAGISMLLFLIQYMFFMGVTKQGLSPTLHIGFLAEKPEILSILKYYIELLGLMPAVLLFGILMGPKGSKWLAIAFTVPLVMATTMQFTISIPGFNHKLVNISIALLNIFPAYGLYKLVTSKKITIKALAVVLIFLMTATGIVDIIAVYNLSNYKKPVKEPEAGKLKEWILKSTDRNSVFLTHTYDNIHPVVSAGRKIYFGSVLFAEIAGYDTAEREKIYKRILSSRNYEEAKKLINENKIDYIIIDDELKNSKEFDRIYFESNYKLEYSDESNKVYKLR
jgi:hypothetical protein